MRTMTRLAVYVAMAAISAPAFADGPRSTPEERERHARAMATSGTAEEQPARDEREVGGASGEPTTAPDARAREEARRSEAAAIQEYHQRRFLRETWAPTP